jgi:hypothetical protein
MAGLAACVWEASFATHATLPAAATAYAVAYAVACLVKVSSFIYLFDIYYCYCYCYCYYFIIIIFINTVTIKFLLGYERGRIEGEAAGRGVGQGEAVAAGPGQVGDLGVDRQLPSGLPLPPLRVQRSRPDRPHRCALLCPSLLVRKNNLTPLGLGHLQPYDNSCRRTPSRIWPKALSRRTQTR